MNQKKNYLTTPKESGFTLVEVIVAVAILSFVIFATLRVITASLNSITRQGQRVKALHLAQAHLAKLEAESFSKVVPENWRIAGATYSLNIYDPDVSASEIFVSSDDDYWYDDGNPNTEDLGFDDTGQVKSDGILVADKDGTPYTVTLTSPPLSENYNWDSTMLTLTFSPDDVEEEIQIYYQYYHLVEEGGTIPSSDGEGLKEKVIKLFTDVGDTNGNDTDGEKDDILGEDLTAGNSLSSSDYDSFNPQTKELTFVDSKKGNSVRIYYLPLRDGQEPVNDSIVGIVEGKLWDPGSESKPPKITPSTIKQITVTEYWKQGNEIKSTQQETYITR
ncbi:hypothetical protein ES703_67065 [subsurface metagenome]